MGKLKADKIITSYGQPGILSRVLPLNRGRKIGLSAGLVLLLGAVPVLGSALSGGSGQNADPAASRTGSDLSEGRGHPVSTSTEPSSGTTSEPSTTPPASNSHDTKKDIDIDASTDVRVNGQDIPVPQNGTVRETVTSDDGSKVKVEVRSNSSSSSTISGSSSTSVKVESNGTSYSSDEENNPGRDRHRR